MQRRIFNHPIRKETTEQFFPDPLNLKAFREVIVNKFDAFAANAINGKFDTDKYIEEWVETYLAWLEIEEER